MTMKNKETVKGYKMFNSDWTCREFKYEVGKTYKTDEPISLCEKGFHFCKELTQCFSHYDCVTWNKFAEVEATGNVIVGEDKFVTNEIRIVREIPFSEIVEIIKQNISTAVNYSDGVNASNSVSYSRGVNRSKAVNNSDGVSGSFGIYNSFAILNSQGVSNGIFVLNKKQTYTLFNKKVSKQRFREVLRNLYICLDGWTPTFNNLKSLYLKHGSKWKLTPIPQAKEISKKEAWADMPQKAIDYLKSLPEFDAEIFTKITGIEM